MDSNRIEQVRKKCVEGIKADERRCREYAEKSLSLAAALSPKIGYVWAAALARKALEQGKTIADIAKEGSGLTSQEAAKVLDLERLTVQPGEERKAPRNKKRQFDRNAGFDQDRTDAFLA